MSVTSFPLALFLLLPGFLFINAAFLVSEFRRLSAFHGTAWSLVVSLLLVAVIYPTYVALVKPPSGEVWPSLLRILENPGLVPGQVWALLYGVAPLAGALAGLAERKRIIGFLFSKIGIDLRMHGDLWSRLLRTTYYIRVYLKDGTLLFGWPELYSINRSQPGPELYLTQAQIWDVDKRMWVDVEGVRGILNRRK
jgi:hypothetical protein